MSKILMTLAEEKENSTKKHFALNSFIDDEDCLDYSRGLQSLGHEVYFVNWSDFKNGEFERMFEDNNSKFVSPLPVDSMDLIFVYKMEGFLRNLSRFYDMLNCFETTNAIIVNDPQTIRHNMDKSYLFELESSGVRTIPTFNLNDQFYQIISSGEKFVIKPKVGERGQEQILASQVKDLDQILDKENYLAQKFCPFVRDGEKSLVFLGFEFQHAVLKKPNPGDPSEYKCNESRGGVVFKYRPTQKEIKFSQNVLKSYNKLGFPPHYSRIDILTDDQGPILLEAELLNPSVYANNPKLNEGQRFGMNLAKYFNSLIQNGN